MNMQLKNVNNGKFLYHRKLDNYGYSELQGQI